MDVDKQEEADVQPSTSAQLSDIAPSITILRIADTG